MSGWRNVRIGEVCDLITGGTPSRSNRDYYQGGTIPWLVSGDIHRGEIRDCEGQITELGLKESNARWLPVNSVIIALNGQGKTRGTVALLRIRATCNQSLVSINPKNADELMPEFLFWNLHGRYEEIRRITGDDGNERRGLNMPLIRNIQIPLPPLEEQRRIVAVLDEAFAAIATATANAEKNLANARLLHESLLNEIFAEDDRWPSREIAQFAHVYDGPHATPKTVDEGPIFLGISALKDGEIRLGKTRHVTPADFETWTRRVKPRPDDVVFSYETRLGQAAIIPEGLECCLGRRMGLLRVKDSAEVLPMFLLRSYLSPSFQCFLRKNTVEGATVDRFSIKDFPKFHMRIPSLETQQRIVRACAEAKRQSDRLAELAHGKLFFIQNLRQSLLHRTFSGDPLMGQLLAA